MYMKGETYNALVKSRDDLQNRLNIVNSIINGTESMMGLEQKHGWTMNHIRRMFVTPNPPYERIRVRDPKELSDLLYGLKTGAERLYDLIMDKSGKHVWDIYVYPDDLEETVEEIISSDSFTERERQVFEYRFCDGLTLEDTGKNLGITRERVRQIEAKMIWKLRRSDRAAMIIAGKAKYEEYKAAASEANSLGYTAAYQKETLESYKDKIEELQKVIDENEDALNKNRNELHKAIINAQSILEENSKSSDGTIIEELNLSVRSYNCLKRAGVNYLADIKNLSMGELLQLRNLGKRSAHEIADKLYEWDGTRLRVES